MKRKKKKESTRVERNGFKWELEVPVEDDDDEEEEEEEERRIIRKRISRRINRWINHGPVVPWKLGWWNGRRRRNTPTPEQYGVGSRALSLPTHARNSHTLAYFLWQPRIEGRVRVTAPNTSQYIGNELTKRDDRKRTEGRDKSDFLIGDIFMFARPGLDLKSRLSRVNQRRGWISEFRPWTRPHRVRHLAVGVGTD